jgi:hypothetical protein
VTASSFSISPDLAGLDGRTFPVAKDVDLGSPILLDILTEKASNTAHTTGVLVQPKVALVPQGAAVALKASEWDEW